MSQIPEDQLAIIKDAIINGQKDSAIKTYRDLTGKSLLAARAEVDHIERDLRKVSPEKFTAVPLPKVAVPKTQTPPHIPEKQSRSFWKKICGEQNVGCGREREWVFGKSSHGCGRSAWICSLGWSRVEHPGTGLEERLCPKCRKKHPNFKTWAEYQRQEAQRRTDDGKLLSELTPDELVAHAMGQLAKMVHPVTGQRIVHIEPPTTAEQSVDAQLVNELIQLVGDDAGFGNKSRIREIGEDINRLGGIEVMRAHYYAVKKQIYFSQDIWDGIGEWRC